MTLTPQLEPTDVAALEQVVNRGEREQLFRDNTIYRHEEPTGTRYTKGNATGTPKRSWQSLDAILRSDSNSASALPAKQMRRSKIFTALAITSSLVFVAGIPSTAREGFSFSNFSASNGILLGGALGAVTFGILAGILFRRASKGYDRAVDVYNDSLGLRLGVMTPAGRYIPPANIEVDQDGYIITQDRLPPGLAPRPNAPAPTSSAPASPTPSGPTPSGPTPEGPSEPAPQPIDSPNPASEPASPLGANALRLHPRM